MNAKEGMRRIGLLLGSIGALAGAIGSYVQFNTLSDRRSQHEQFSAMLNQPDLKAVRDAVARKNWFDENAPSTTATYSPTQRCHQYTIT